MYVIFPAEELINISLGISPTENLSLHFNKRIMSGEVTLKELTHPSLNEALKTHNAVTFKLVRTVSDFTQQLSVIYEQHAEELQHLVEGYRKKNAELRKERPTCPSSVFHAWETLLQEVEVDSQAHTDIASILGRQVSRPLLERSFYRKIQSRKVFTHRESYDTILKKTEDMLAKCRHEYKTAFLAYMSAPSNGALATYFDAHNAYVQQLHATNGMLEEYSQETLPQLLQELEEVYTDLCTTLADSVLQGAEIISTRAVEQGRRYDGLSAMCRSVSGPQDLAHFVRSLAAPPPANNRHNFMAPHPPPPPTPEDGGDLAAAPTPAPNAAAPSEGLASTSSLLNLKRLSPDSASTAVLRVTSQERVNYPEGPFNTDVESGLSLIRFNSECGSQHLVECCLQPPPLRNELTIERLASIHPIRPRYDALRKEAGDLETQIKQLTDALDTLLRMQQRSVESSLYNKANELQEDISLKRFDLRVAQIHLAAVRSQKELFATKVESAADNSGRERKMSSSSTGSMKSKWLKAFKSLKTTSGGSSSSQAQAAVASKEPEKKNGKDNGSGGAAALPDNGAHLFQEYTYKKITPCDVCSQVLRGHTRQGLKCRVCKLNVHVDCQERATRCQTKSRLLRRQKSTSEIETRVAQEPPLDEEKPQEVDMIYQVLKQAGEISGGRRGATPTPDKEGGGGIIMAGGSGAGSAASSGSSSAASLHRRPPYLRGNPGPGPHPSVALTVGVNPASSSSAESMIGDTISMSAPAESTRQRRRLFAGMKSLSVFHSRPSAHAAAQAQAGHSHSRSISLPESLRTTPRTIEPGTGTRPFGQPLVLSPSISENGSIGEEAGGLPSAASCNVTMYHPTPSQQQYNCYNNQQQYQHHYHHQQQDVVTLVSPGGMRIPTTAPHSPRRHKLNLRMKSLSLDSPESTEHVQRRRHAATDGQGGPSSQSSSSHIQSPSSPVHNRRLLSARNMRMSSVELPDDNEKSLSSASTSPCPSPKPHRLLPTNLYVVLYNFKSRHPDELDLKAGYKVTVIDTTDVDWWRGKCLGRIGYFPSKYVIKLQPGERPLQVTHNLQVSDGDNGLMLLRDQIVIQVGEELDGMVMIRSGENRQGVCPLKFLQEV